MTEAYKPGNDGVALSSLVDIQTQEERYPVDQLRKFGESSILSIWNGKLCWRRIQKRKRIPARTGVTFSTAGGASLTTTHMLPIPLRTGEFKPASSLRLGDQVMVCSRDGGGGWQPIVDLDVAPEQPFMNMTIEQCHSFFANSILVHH